MIALVFPGVGTLSTKVISGDAAISRPTFDFCGFMVRIFRAIPKMTMAGHLGQLENILFLAY